MSQARASLNFFNKIMRVFAIFIIMILVVALFLPSEYNLKAQIKVPTSVEMAWQTSMDFPSWKNWSPLFKIDTAASLKATPYQGIEWKGELIGEGTVSILKADSLKSLSLLVEFSKPNPLEIRDLYSFESITADTTLLIWSSKGDLAYPLERVFGAFLTSRVQENYQKGLNSFGAYLNELTKLKETNIQLTHLDSTSSSK